MYKEIKINKGSYTTRKCWTLIKMVSKSRCGGIARFTRVLFELPRWRIQRENTKRILLLFSYGNIICRHLKKKNSGLHNLMDIHFITFWKYLIV